MAYRRGVGLIGLVSYLVSTMSSRWDEHDHGMVARSADRAELRLWTLWGFNVNGSCQLFLHGTDLYFCVSASSCILETER